MTDPRIEAAADRLKRLHKPDEVIWQSFSFGFYHADTGRTDVIIDEINGRDVRRDFVMDWDQTPRGEGIELYPGIVYYGDPDQAPTVEIHPDLAVAESLEGEG